MKRQRIGLIGAVGENEKTCSGQIIRTMILLKSLQKHYGVSSIVVANTSLIKSNPLRFFMQFLHVFVSTKKSIVILSQNGMRRIWPLLSIWSKYFGKTIYNNIIGGNLLAIVEKHPELIRYMKTFEINWVQMVSMQTKLAKKGITNTEVLPNSKPINALDAAALESRDNKPLRFCTFSRVSREKGIELAVETIQQINRDAGKTIVTLDIYGEPDTDYEFVFKKLMRSVPDSISYGGVVPYDQSVDTLKQYFMLLFPTTFDGEGFPGTIIDAYASATPVIASNWSFNAELIEEKVTGLLYDYQNPEQFAQKIIWSIKNTETVNAMRTACLSEAAKYATERVMPIIFNRLERTK